MLTQYNVISNIFQCDPVLGDITEDDVQAGVLPFFHIVKKKNLQKLL